MKAVMKEWTKEEKHVMLKVTDGIHNLLKEMDNPLMSAFVIELINNAVQEEAGIAKIGMINVEKGTVSELKEKVNHVRSIIEHMNKSNVNIVLFRDDDEVWMQYYMGKFLGLPTMILCKDEHREILKHYNVEDKLFIVEDYNDIDAEKLGKAIQEVVKE